MSRNDNQQKKKGFSIGRLFQSNRFVLIFSLFAAVVLWFVMAINNTENRARVIYDIPISVALSDEMEEQGYQIFEQSDTTASVSVTGNSLAVNQLSEEDITISAALASSITRTGTYTLNLSASKTSSLTDYEFDTISPGSVIVFVDKYAEKTLTVEQDLDYTVAEGYYVAKPALSEKKVTVSGPESEVSQIASVAVERDIAGELTESMEFSQGYTFYDQEGSRITDLDHISLSSDGVTVRIEVLKRAELPVAVTYTNLMEGVDLSQIVTVSPETLKVGYDTQTADSGLTSISLEPMDLSEVNLEHTTFSLDFELPANYTNISGVKQAVLKFDLTNYAEQSFTVDNLVVENVPEGETVTVDTEQLQVTIVGPESLLETMKASELYAQIDIEGEDGVLNGSVEVAAAIHIPSKYGAWAYGSYTASVTITN